MAVPAVQRPAEHVSDVLSAGSLRYSQVWEDSETARLGLALHEGDDVVSICGAGCNVLAMLLSRPRRIVAVDLNRAQTAVLELKLAALRSLSHAEFVALLGARDRLDRVSLYERVRFSLEEGTRAYWDGHTDDIARGIIGCGRLDRYFRAFQSAELARPDRSRIVHDLLSASDRSAQKRLFEQLEATGLRTPFVEYFGRESMAQRGRHDTQFRHVTIDDVGAWFWERFRHACTELPTRNNWYLEWFLTSSYRDLNSAPCYLQPRHFDTLRSLSHRVSIVTGDVISLLRDEPRAHAKANLSDIFEYLSEDETAEALDAIAGGLVPGGRLCYWNLLVPRERPRTLATRLRSRAALGRTLWKRDRSWFYRAVRVEEVIA